MVGRGERDIDRSAALSGEAARLRGEAEYLLRKIAEYDRILLPVRQHEDGIKQAIRDTHGRKNGMLVFNLGGAPARKPMFAALDEISREWGGVRNEKAELAKRLKAYERDIETIGRELTRLQQRRKSSGKTTGPTLL